MTAKLTTTTNGTSFPWLLADIGGSNARFGLKLSKDAEISHIRTIPVALHATPVMATQTYLDEVSDIMGDSFQSPCKAAFAVATAVTDDQVAFTNSHWSFSRTKVQDELKLTNFLVLNDFEALALSLPRLNPSQLRAHKDLPTACGTLAVIGPGTGLGVAGVTQTKLGWIALPCEGGHATLAATNNFESAVLAQVRQTYPHVSAERLLSGIGLPVLHAAVATLRGAPSPQLTAEIIVARGLDHSDAICSETLDTFCALLGSFAGNVALILGARGGVYIGGGIVPRLGERFFSSRFRECFEAKGRLDNYLKQIPTALITDTLAALTGAAFAIEQLDA
ncbi:glucokinase [Undibacterium sp. Ren11W]|uniref:glucokinase n=1 Tax=Undibacterium sp. Ren11W TaxID=3413045 RepID=UPI003BF3B2E9